MATITINAEGMKCPTPTLMLTNQVIGKKVSPGDTLIVLADCPTFEKDVKDWCKTMKKVLLLYTVKGGVQEAHIRI